MNKNNDKKDIMQKNTKKMKKNEWKIITLMVCLISAGN